MSNFNQSASNYSSSDESDGSFSIDSVESGSSSFENADPAKIPVNYRAVDGDSRNSKHNPPQDPSRAKKSTSRRLKNRRERRKNTKFDYKEKKCTCNYDQCMKKRPKYKLPHGEPRGSKLWKARGPSPHSHDGFGGNVSFEIKSFKELDLRQSNKSKHSSIFDDYYDRDARKKSRKRSRTDTRHDRNRIALDRYWRKKKMKSIRQREPGGENLQHVDFGGLQKYPRVYEDALYSRDSRRKAPSDLRDGNRNEKNETDNQKILPEMVGASSSSSITTPNPAPVQDSVERGVKNLNESWRNGNRYEMFLPGSGIVDDLQMRYYANKKLIQWNPMENDGTLSSPQESNSLIADSLEDQYKTPDTKADPKTLIMGNDKTMLENTTRTLPWEIIKTPSETFGISATDNHRENRRTMQNPRKKCPSSDPIDLRIGDTDTQHNWCAPTEAPSLNVPAIDDTIPTKSVQLLANEINSSRKINIISCIDMKSGVKINIEPNTKDDGCKSNDSTIIDQMESSEETIVQDQTIFSIENFVDSHQSSIAASTNNYDQTEYTKIDDGFEALEPAENTERLEAVPVRMIDDLGANKSSGTNDSASASETDGNLITMNSQIRTVHRNLNGIISNVGMSKPPEPEIEPPAFSAGPKVKPIKMVDETNRKNKLKLSPNNDESRSWSIKTPKPEANASVSTGGARVFVATPPKPIQNEVQSVSFALEHPEVFPDEDEQMRFIEQLIRERDIRTFVHCDKCDKIRCLENVFDPTTLDDTWYCTDRLDLLANGCAEPQEDIPETDQAEWISNRYNIGSVVWAKLDGYPWWPAMVEDDPDARIFFWCEQNSLDPASYHVRFFDENEISGVWVDPANIKPFRINDPERKQNVSRYRRVSKKRFSNAVRIADEALKMDVFERITKFRYLARFFTKKKKKQVPRRRNDMP